MVQAEKIMWNSQLIERAIFVMTNAHENQKMKWPIDMPYSAHPTAVLLEAIKYCHNEDLNWDILACCALLHDVLEDTSVTYEDIVNDFGLEIADGVSALTKNDKIEKSKRMQDSLDRIQKQPKEIAIVKMADRLFNIRERVPVWSLEKQNEYLAEANVIYDALKYANENLACALKSAIINLTNECQ